MYDLIASERAMMLPIVSERLSSETDLEIADALEKAVVYLWAAKTPCADEAAKILCALPADPRLRAYQLVQEPWLWKPSYEEFVAVAPDEDRWTWWVQQGMKPPDEAAILKLIGQLQESIRNAIDLVHFVQSVGPARQWSLLLDPWCASNLTLFKDAALHPSASEPTREILGRAVRRAELREHPERLVSRVRELVSDGASAEIVKVLEDGAPVAVEYLRRVSRDCAEARAVEVRALVFGYPFANPQLATTERLEHAEVALRDGDWSGYWDPVWALVHPPQAFAALALRPSLVERLYERIGEALRSATDFITPTHEWHLDQLITILERIDNHARIRLLEASLSDQTTYYLGALAGPLATDDDRLEALVGLLGRLLRGGALKNVSSVRVVLTQALRDGHLPPVALEMGRAFVSGSDECAARVGLALLAELRTSSKACAEVCEIAADSTHPLHDEADSAASAFMSPRGVYGGAIGAVPPAFLELQRTVTEARDHARTSAGRARILRLVDHVARSIESHKRDDEEVLDPHG